MPRSNSKMIHNLQQAINTKYDYKLLYNQTQWYSDIQNRPVKMYVVKRAVWDDDKGKYKNVELFSSTSQLQIVLFMRDLWFELEGKPLPTGNETWNEVRRKYKIKNDIP